jgi:hypothetical protein
MMTPETLGTFSMPLEVYFQTGMVRGVLVTNQDRLSNFLILRDGDEVFTLADATLELPGAAPEIKTEEFIVYMQQSAVIADLSPKLGSQRHLYVKKDANKALLSVGPYWIKGNVHLTPGASIHDVLMAKTRFIPVTDAAFVNRTDLPPRTFLVNRNHVSCIAALG